MSADSAFRRPVARGRRLTIINATRDCHDVYECEANNGVPPAAIRDISVTVECQYSPNDHRCIVRSPPLVVATIIIIVHCKQWQSTVQSRITANTNQILGVGFLHYVCVFVSVCNEEGVASFSQCRRCSINRILRQVLRIQGQHYVSVRFEDIEDRWTCSEIIVAASLGVYRLKAWQQCNCRKVPRVNGLKVGRLPAAMRRKQSTKDVI